MCAGCHTPPGGEKSPVAKGFYPQPPELDHAAEEMNPAQLFWVVKHGIKATGMAAWGPTHPDDALWNIVALVEQFPGMSGQQYKTLKTAAAGQGGHHGGGDSGDHGHGGGDTAHEENEHDRAGDSGTGGHHGADRAHAEGASSATGTDSHMITIAMKANATATKRIIALCGLALTGLLLVAGCGQPANQSDSAGDSRPTAVMYKNPNCGCCTKWAEHLRTNGFEVDVREQARMAPVKNRLGVPGDMRSCHTAVIGDYVIEGHVPADNIRRLLAEQPEARGLAVPGMPLGSPGMEVGDRRQSYTVWLMQNRGTRAFNRYPVRP